MRIYCIAVGRPGANAGDGGGDAALLFTPGTFSDTDYMEEAAPNYRFPDIIYRSILEFEEMEPDGLNGFLLLSYVGAGSGRPDKFFRRLPALIAELKARGDTVFGGWMHCWGGSEKSGRGKGERGNVQPPTSRFNGAGNDSAGAWQKKARRISPSGFLMKRIFVRAQPQPQPPPSPPPPQQPPPCWDLALAAKSSPRLTVRAALAWPRMPSIASAACSRC